VLELRHGVWLATGLPSISCNSSGGFNRTRTWHDGPLFHNKCGWQSSWTAELLLPRRGIAFLFSRLVASRHRCAHREITARSVCFLGRIESHFGQKSAAISQSQPSSQRTCTLFQYFDWTRRLIGSCNRGDAPARLLAGIAISESELS
jgi:hypothetical protein